MKLSELQRKRAALVEQALAVVRAAETASRDLTDAERDTLDGLRAEVETVRRDIVIADGLEEEQRQLERAARPETRPEVGDDQKRRDPSKWTGLGEFLTAVRTAEMTRGQVIDPRLSTRAATGASETVPSDGGFLVQPDLATELLRRTYETGVLTSKVRKLPLGPNSNGIRINAVDETSRASGSRWGGVQTYWAGEADALTASRPKFRQMEMLAHKLTGLFYATDEVLQDSTALEAVAMEAFAEEFGFKLDDALIRGTGAGQPLGILNSPCLVTVNKEAGQAAATLLVENITKMWSRCWGRSRSQAIWYINQDAEPQLFQLGLQVGVGGVPLLMPAGGLGQANLPAILGRPIQPLEQCASLGTLGDILLADFSQYVMIEKGGLQTASSIHVRFLQDESVFRFILRTDGQPFWSAALTPANGSNTLSPFVALQTR